MSANRCPRERFRTLRLIACGLLGGLPMAAPLHAQWSAAPTLAVGPVIPTGALGDVANEGLAVKAGAWLRAPRVPVGLAVEAMYAHFRAGANGASSTDTRVGAVLANITTRRHARRLELYGSAGGGYYWLDGASASLAGRRAAGVNIGVGEIIALGSHDYFVELRLHAVRTPAQSPSRWMTFMPLLLGIRF